MPRLGPPTAAAGRTPVVHHPAEAGPTRRDARASARFYPARSPGHHVGATPSSWLGRCPGDTGQPRGRGGRTLGGRGASASAPLGTPNMNTVKRVRFAEPLEVHESESLETRRKEEEDEGINYLAQKYVSKILTSAVSKFRPKRRSHKSPPGLTHGDFSEEAGLQHIDELVKEWEHESRWVHHTEFQGREDLGHSFLYRYCVYWSVPTAQVPLPKVQTTTDFTIKFNKNKPPDAPVDISYTMDHQSLVQKPGEGPFREKWLRDFLLAKYILLESVPVTRHAYDLEKIKL